MAAPEQITRYLDFSGGLQTATSRLLMKDNELSRATNARYDKKIGGGTRRSGYEMVGFPVQAGKAIKGGNSYFRKDGNNNLLVVANDSGDSNATIKYLNNVSWSNVIATLDAGARLDFENFLDKAFYTGHTTITDTFVQTSAIDRTLSVSTTDDVYGAPRGKYIVEYGDKLYVANCWTNGKKHSDRVYASSNPTDAITYINGDQKGLLLQLEIDSTRYLKAGMTIDIYGENSNQKKVDSLTIIDVDKADNRITFAETSIDVSDRDEIYIEDKKGTLGLLWNIDYPNPDTSDFLAVPPVNNEVPDITGVAVASNRLIIFTEHSIRKWDGANLVKVSEKIGTTSYWSIKEMNGWLLFINKMGVWGYNVDNNQLQLLSRGIQNYIDAINQPNFYNAVAVTKGDYYKVWVGGLGTVDDRTTSTSTSSTSTSSTSSSTSSTSTSSTSTSSTSSSTSATTISTSSTSSSTSSTSISTSSTSISTSSTSISTSSTSISTSTSTTTLVTGTTNNVLVYDFSMNTWAVDEIDREIQTAFLHTMHGYEKIYFGDNNGRFFRDETGLKDEERAIPFLIETKRFNLDRPEETKTFRRVYVYSQDGQYANIHISIDGGEWQAKGQLEKNVTVIDLGDMRGRDIAFRVTQNNSGEPVVFIGVSIIWLREGLQDADS